MGEVENDVEISGGERRARGTKRVGQLNAKAESCTPTGSDGGCWWCGWCLVMVTTRLSSRSVSSIRCRASFVSGVGVVEVLRRRTGSMKIHPYDITLTRGSELIHPFFFSLFHVAHLVPLVRECTTRREISRIGFREEGLAPPGT